MLMCYKNLVMVEYGHTDHESLIYFSTYTNILYYNLNVHIIMHNINYVYITPTTTVAC